MRRRNEPLSDFLLKWPWWVSVALGLLVFSALRWGIPIWSGDNRTRQVIAKEIVPFAHFAMVIFGMFAIGSYWFGIKRRRLVDTQNSLEKLRETPWKDFEYLVAEVYKRQGFHVEYSLGRGADGGVDLVLRKDGRTSLVQCKQWKVFSVGAPVIRELFGVLTAEKADEAIIVTTGTFTREARGFAEGKPMQLVDGPLLLGLVQSVQTHHGESPSDKAMSDSNATPGCPACGKPMVLRTARRGANAGSQFWGCSGYPGCKKTCAI
jgi:restriction system protein